MSPPGDTPDALLRAIWQKHADPGRAKMYARSRESTAEMSRRGMGDSGYSITEQLKIQKEHLESLLRATVEEFETRAGADPGTREYVSGGSAVTTLRDLLHAEARHISFGVGGRRPAPYQIAGSLQREQSLANLENLAARLIAVLAATPKPETSPVTVTLSLVQIAELMLVRAYEGSKNGSRYSVEFHEVAQALGVTWNLAFRALKLLEDRGLVECRWGERAAIGHVTPGGHALVEGGGSTGIIPRYQHDRGAFVVAGPGSMIIMGTVTGDVSSNGVSIGGNVTGSTIQAGVGNQAGRDWDKIRDVIAQLQSSVATLPMSAEARADIGADLAAAAAQAGKSQPDALIVRPFLQSVERSLGVLDKAGGALTFITLVASAIKMLQ